MHTTLTRKNTKKIKRKAFVEGRRKKENTRKQKGKINNNKLFPGISLPISGSNVFKLLKRGV